MFGPIMQLAHLQDWIFNAQTFREHVLHLRSQVLEDQAALPEAPEHRHPDVHPGLVPM